MLRKINAIRVNCIDNAIIILNEDLTVKGTRVKGVVSKESVVKIPFL